MTQTAIAVWEPDQQEMDIYRRHYAPKDITDDEWEIFLQTCRAYRVSPMRRQIYLVGRYDGVKKRMINTPQISIGTLRLLALRTNEFEGTTEPEWADEDGTWHTCWPKSKGKHPYAARVGIYRKNFRKPVWGVVYFHEVAQTTKDSQGNKRYTKFWEDSGIHQLAKCAEADGLRKAFEEECGGVYIHEEMLQADSDRPPVSVIPVVESDDPETNEALKETAAQTAQPTEQPKAKPAAQPQANGHQEQGSSEISPAIGRMIDNAKKRAEALGVSWETVKKEARVNFPDTKLVASSFVHINGWLTKAEAGKE